VEARRAHNPKDAGSNPAPATNLPPSLDPYIHTLAQMNPTNQQMVLNLIRGLAERDGIPLAHTIAPGLQAPAEGIPLWLASLKAEQYSPRTVDNYQRIAKYYLRFDPYPTLLSIQSYLANRLDRVSSSRVAMERKALRSFFRFLHSSGLWPTDPTSNIKPIRVRYSKREIPSEEDIIKLLRAKCYRSRDTVKFRLMVILLLDTGLRVWEACSIRRSNINYEQLEITVIGKGGKERVVPISPLTASLLRAWIEQNGESEWLFPIPKVIGMKTALRRQLNVHV
jgi:integrase